MSESKLDYIYSFVLKNKNLSYEDFKKALFIDLGLTINDFYKCIYNIDNPHQYGRVKEILTIFKEMKDRSMRTINNGSEKKNELDLLYIFVLDNMNLEYNEFKERLKEEFDLTIMDLNNRLNMIETFDQNKKAEEIRKIIQKMNKKYLLKKNKYKNTH